MRKFIIAGMALAVLAIIPSAASADVQRCEASVPVSTDIKTATFTTIQPANEYNQWNNVWTHDFTVIVNPDNTFAGVGTSSAPMRTASMRATGRSPASSPTPTPVNLVATRSDGLVVTLNNETMGDDMRDDRRPCRVDGEQRAGPAAGRGHRGEGVGSGHHQDGDDHPGH